jgi:hypothetical protein
MCGICELTYFKSGAITPESLPAATTALAVGDPVYLIRKGKIVEYPVQRIEISKSITTYSINWHGCGYEVFTERDFGKRVFITKEDAERGLAAMQQNEKLEMRNEK